MKKVMISPSILGIKDEELPIKINAIEKCGVEYLHFDVMDGKFVPNTSFSLETLKNIANIHHLVNDVHIMIEKPLDFAKGWLDSGADILTFHYEACPNDEYILKLINLIHSQGKKAGISIKPKTPVEVIDKFVPLVDLVLVMSVEPGFGGQSFIPSALDKIKYLRTLIDQNKYNCLIEVDGGINQDTGKACVDSGVDILVAGSYIFKSDSIEERIKSLR